MSCPQCFAGHINPGEPKGRMEKVYGLQTYIAEPPTGEAARGIIVIVPDAFGLPFVNNKILADHYAAMGQYLVYLPDFMNGTPASVQCMINMAHLSDAKTSWFATPYYLMAVVAEFLPFLIRNRFGVRWPGVQSFFRALRADKGATLPVGVAGFCWGGPYAIRLTHDNADAKTLDGRQLVDAAFAAHPSNVEVPGDFEKVQKPLSVAIGDDDAILKIGEARKAKTTLDGRSDIESEFVIFPGAKHGFAVRASKAVPDSTETRQSEEAEKQAIAWFQRHFAAAKAV